MSRVWWQCERGHEWQAVIFSRVQGAGCPVCAGRVRAGRTG
ncbi:MAG: zinc-ribbon domain-containing protein [Dysosmobacter sp.]|nr:zinc-ribbon domain-containing protein [Dysosmobacter sp.]